GVHGFDLETDSPSDKPFQLRNVPRLFVKQPINYFLIGQHSIAHSLVSSSLAQDLAENLIANRFRSLQLAAALTTAARFAQHLLKTFAGTLAGHLHQAQFGNTDNVGRSEERRVGNECRAWG